MTQHVLMPRNFVRLLIGAGALIFGLGCSVADVSAAQKKHHARTVPQKTVTVVAKRKAATRPRSLVIVSKAPNDAPDFDYQDRVQEAQELAAKQPVLKDDMQFD